MRRYLILKLDGPMQAWGGHTFEDYRPSHPFPTRSGLLGLIGACLGLERRDSNSLETLANSVRFTVRRDPSVTRQQADADGDRSVVCKPAIKLRDFHTVLEARRVDGKPGKNPIVSQREYLHDAVFSVAVGGTVGAAFSLDAIAAALHRPRYTPFLGRRSCPIANPLFYSWVESAADGRAALHEIPPGAGPIYSEEEELRSQHRQLIRDVPQYGERRQFDTRQIFMLPEEE